MRLLIFLFVSANVAFSQKPITSVEIEHLIVDSTLNVRALELYRDEVYIASSDGRVMKLRQGAAKFMPWWEVDTINKPNFRSLAVTKDGVYALSIGSPALLYKNGEVVYLEEHEAAFYDAMEFWNAEEGIAMGDPTEGCISIVTTRDYGNTWSKISCNELPEAIEGEAAFAASDTNIKIVGDSTWIATGGKVSRILFSPDKGENWVIYETPFLQGKPTTGMYSIDFYDGMFGFAIGGDYTDPDGNNRNKALSMDGGRTWQLVAEGADPGYRSCVQYVPGSEGEQLIAIGFKGIDVSNDGGHSWTHLSDEGYYTLRVLDKHTAYAAGNGRVSRLRF